MQPLLDSAHLVPRLATYARLAVDPLTKQPVLLYPEGIRELDETAAAILQQCDGKSLRAIASQLAMEYEAPIGQIEKDAYEFLKTLASAGLIVLKQEKP
jgi:pyrroloquinoline quinone biosynthesis protein D